MVILGQSSHDSLVKSTKHFMDSSVIPTHLPQYKVVNLVKYFIDASVTFGHPLQHNSVKLTSWLIELSLISVHNVQSSLTKLTKYFIDASVIPVLHRSSVKLILYLQHYSNVLIHQLNENIEKQSCEDGVGVVISCLGPEAKFFLLLLILFNIISDYLRITIYFYISVFWLPI